MALVVLSIYDVGGDNMMKLTEEEKEKLLGSNRDINFLLDDQMEKIERVEIFYEDCKNCSESKRCPSRDEFEEGGRILQNMHEYLEEQGIDSTLHPLTFEDKENVGEIVSKNGGVLPVIACFDLDVPIFSSKHNYFYMELEDGRRFLYMLQVDLLKEESEVQKERMIYG